MSLLRNAAILMTVPFLFAAVAASRASPSARVQYVQQVERLRELARPHPHSTELTPEDVRWRMRLALLDQEIDVLAPAEGGTGHGRMWTISKRPALEGVVESTRPLMVELVALVHERQGRPLPSCPRLQWSLHHTNLLCARAIVAGDDGAALEHLCDAIDAGTCIDDGSVIAGMVIDADLITVADAAQRIAESSPSACDFLTSELVPHFDRFRSKRAWAQRMADCAIRSVDEDWIRDYEPVELLEELHFLRRLESRLREPDVRSCGATDVLTLRQFMLSEQRAWSGSRYLLRPRS